MKVSVHIPAEFGTYRAPRSFMNRWPRWASGDRQPGTTLTMRAALEVSRERLTASAMADHDPRSALHTDAVLKCTLQALKEHTSREPAEAFDLGISIGDKMHRRDASPILMWGPMDSIALCMRERVLDPMVLIVGKWQRSYSYPVRLFLVVRLMSHVVPTLEPVTRRVSLSFMTGEGADRDGGDERRAGHYSGVLDVKHISYDVLKTIGTVRVGLFIIDFRLSSYRGPCSSPHPVPYGPF